MKTQYNWPSLPMETYSLGEVLDRCVPEEHHMLARNAIMSSEEMMKVVKKDGRCNDYQVLGAASLESVELFLRQRGFQIFAPLNSSKSSEEKPKSLYASRKSKPSRWYAPKPKAQPQPQIFKLEDAKAIATEEIGRIASGLETNLHQDKNRDSVVISISDIRETYCIPNSSLVKYKGYLGPLSIGNHLGSSGSIFGYSGVKVLGLMRIMLYERMRNVLASTAVRKSAQEL